MYMTIFFFSPSSAAISAGTEPADYIDYTRIIYSKTLIDIGITPIPNYDVRPNSKYTSTRCARCDLQCTRETRTWRANIVQDSVKLRTRIIVLKIGHLPAATLSPRWHFVSILLRTFCPARALSATPYTRKTIYRE